MLKKLGLGSEPSLWDRAATLLSMLVRGPGGNIDVKEQNRPWNLRYGNDVGASGRFLSVLEIESLESGCGDDDYRKLSR